MELKGKKMYIYFWNKDISFNNRWKFLKFDTHVHEGHLEETMSHNCCLGPSSHFMKNLDKKLIQLLGYRCSKILK